MAEPPNKRRSVRQAKTRKRSVYAEPETEDELEGTMSDTDSEVQLPPAKKAKTKTARPGPSSQTRSKAAAKAASTSSRRSRAPKRQAKQQSKNKTKTKGPGQIVPVIPSDGVRPPWQDLPYEILLQIFRYAYDPPSYTKPGPGGPGSGPTWLIRAARKVCRAFAEPALTAFYESPTLLSPLHLQALLKRPDQSINYNAKIKRIECAFQLFGSTSDAFDLSRLIPDTPQLAEIMITHPRDHPPYRIQKPPRWTYPSNLFLSLNELERRLKSWRWNVLLMEQGKQRHLTDACQFIMNQHLAPAMQSLQHLEIANFSNEAKPSSTPSILQPSDEQELAQAIGALPKLRSLAVESSELLTSEFFQRLPSSLHRLRIANCATLDSDMLYTYLSGEAGSCQLRELVLDHNPRLDLAFLPTLKATCPHLQVLKMDLHYYSTHFNVDDAAPQYDYLLGSDEVPTWPTTLRTLELVHLQNWSTHPDAARNLYRSLVESAEDLPDLRRLVLHAHINISWRDRAAFRDQWIERLLRVYQRYPTPPDPRLASFKAWRIWQQSQKLPSYPATGDGHMDGTSQVGARRLSHVRITPRKSEAASLDSDSSDSEPLSKRRSTRIAEQIPTPPQEAEQVAPQPLRKRGRKGSDAISIASDREEATKGDWRNVPEKYIQGLCDVVDIRIDNQRPREEQYNESHFLDSEVSGDEEWTEGDEIPADEYAW